MADQVHRASTEIDSAIPEIWSANFYPTLLAALPFKDLIADDYEGEIRALGDTVHVQSIPEFDDATDIQEDEKNDADAVTISQTDLVINKQTVKDYIITDRAKRQSLSVDGGLKDMAMYSIMKKMQSNILSLIVPSASAPDHQIAYDSGSTLALADILEGKELLDSANVPDDGLRSIVMDAPQWNDLFNITGFTSRDFIPAGSPLTQGSFSSNLLGFKPELTTEASAVTYLFHRSFMQMAVQEEPEVKVYDLGSQGKRAERVNVTSLYGIKQFGDTRVVTIS